MMWQATFESMEADLKEMNNGVETLERNLVELQELHYVLQYTDPFFAHVSSIDLNDVILLWLGNEESPNVYVHNYTRIHRLTVLKVGMLNSFF